MGRAVFLPVVWPETKLYRDNVLLQNDLFQPATPPRTAAASFPDPTAGYCQSTLLPETPKHSQAILAQSLVGSLLLSSGSWGIQGFASALQELVSPVLWKFCHQISLIFKVRFPEDSVPLLDPPVGKCCGPRTFTELLWYNFSPVYGSPIWC